MAVLINFMGISVWVFYEPRECYLYTLHNDTIIFSKRHYFQGQLKNELRKSYTIKMAINPNQVWKEKLS